MRQKLKGMQTIQRPATPRQAACKTNARTRSKTQKTHSRQNAAKASAARSADCRPAGQSARQAYLRGRHESQARARSRATQTSTDVETSKTAQPTALPSTASSGMHHRDGAAARRSFKMSRVDGVLVG